MSNKNAGRKKRLGNGYLVLERHRKWNQFDPIGVAHRVDDEYDSYVARTAKLLAEGTDKHRVADHVRKGVCSLGLPNIRDDEILAFAQELTRLTL
jgi:hypothetical protein